MAVLGAGRLGTALAGALRAAAVAVAGPYGRDSDPFGDDVAPDVVLLCVPDAEILRASAQFPDGQLLAHCSGAAGLDRLGSHEGFSLHPLTAVTRTGADFRGVGAAIDATTPAALELARGLARALGMIPIRIDPADRAAYHAAASIASNFLVTLEAAAEQLADSAGLRRELLAPLVRATVENWLTLGPEQALTGPVARGDHATVAHQREAVAQRAPELLGLFDALVVSTDRLAARVHGVPA
ncbi:MAG TPA: DUF2520 domain-containing protein [Solirubrobacteraceae bacterium]|nr:DUF2520 domain-containing protein [Solirubrobacteraceae bacterium]